MKDKTMERSDHIYVYRNGYIHHGIYCGGGKVIHYSGNVYSIKNASVTIVSIHEFSKGRMVRIKQYAHADSADKVMSRAFSRLGEKQYSLFMNNCEHFATWCKTGKAESRQVEYAKRAVFGVVAGLAGQRVRKLLVNKKA